MLTSEHPSYTDFFLKTNLVADRESRNFGGHRCSGNLGCLGYFAPHESFTSRQTNDDDVNSLGY